MSNSAIIMQAGHHAGVYIHWNGGRDSVKAFLAYCKLRDFPSFSTTSGLARFCQVYLNFTGHCDDCDILTEIDTSKWTNSGLDNGIYAVAGFEICGRTEPPAREQDEYDLLDMMVAIDNAQPAAQQLGEQYIRADVVRASSIKLGDEVFIMDPVKGRADKFTVVGFGEKGRYVNGTLIEDIPYVDRYDHDGDYSWNINNYVGAFGERVRRVATK